MNGIQPQRIDVEIAEPRQRIVNYVAPDTIAPGIVDINGLAPGGFVLVGQVGPELTQGVALRPEVVIHHVEHDG